MLTTTVVAGLILGPLTFHFPERWQFNRNLPYPIPPRVSPSERHGAEAVLCSSLRISGDASIAMTDLWARSRTA